MQYDNQDQIHTSSSASQPAKAPSKAVNLASSPTQQPIWTEALGDKPPSSLQAKLTISQPGDAYEQEADRVSEQVMRMPASETATSSTISEQDEGESLMSKEGKGSGGTQAIEGAPPIVNQVLTSGGQPLDAETRTFMESRFGQDFSHVRVHTDEQASESAEAVNARAYTVGKDMVFGVGQYEPGTSEGQRLLAHELTHVVQQSNIKAQRTSWGPKITNTSMQGVKRLQRATFNVGSVTVNVNYGTLIRISVSDYERALESRFTSWTNQPATVIHHNLTTLTPRQKEWVLFALHLLMDNTTPAHSRLNRVQAVQQLIAHAPLSTTSHGSSSFDFENEALQVSGWFEVALSAPLTAPTGATLGTITGLYNPPIAGALNVGRLNRELPPALTALLNSIDPARWAAVGTQALAPLQTIGDRIQDEARTFFSPYADTAIANRYAANWRYSANIFRVTASTPNRDQRIGYLLNRAEIVGRQTGPGGSIFSNVNFDSSRSADSVALLRIVTRMEADPSIRAVVNRLVQHTGRTQVVTHRVGLSTEFNLGTMTDCDARWRTIRTLCHELIHVLVHPRFPDRANTIRFGQIVREGFTDALTVQLFTHLVAMANANPAFKGQMELGLATPCPVPPLTTVGYRQAGASAEQIRTLVHDDNFRAAYFLGAVHLVGL